MTEILEGTISGWNWVIATYALTWVTLGVYAAHVLRRLSAAEREHAAPVVVSARGDVR